MCAQQGKNPGKKRTVGKDPIVKERLLEVCKVVWNGVLTRMARDLGMPQAALWRVLHDDYPVNAALLTALAGHGAANLQWVLTGLGPRLLNEEPQAAGSALPVAATYLPGPPHRHPDLLDIKGDPPVASVSPGSGYWIRLGASDPAARRRGAHLAPGDWLLFETDRQKFPPEEEMVGRLVVVPAATIRSAAPKLGRVESVEEGRLEVDTFEVDRDPNKFEDVIVLREQPDGSLHGGRTTVTWGGPVPGRRVRSEELLRHLPVMRYENVPAVCVLSCRPRP